ncbi:C-5 cytosine methyltransferase DmtA [Talaromyces stipitatus ATCC 10500]|uniref:DNA (cytosine-5-)-methyltransferase n=1 Tax=Talaromyces stipitatus (strain ATCC 10500 / CBS 375.48 / QM 6759 / NRRL 1006) TaxID=441959 RepID=B8M4M9_TALSN|nr:C-5 cytosine methyltransferase DmtA [Talaromyces stipitatus ATCC 10500]EED19224.1 C-5 cytosine methyltransferase DmtA [Talaromyces stipitatus ATCC 10500]
MAKGGQLREYPSSAPVINISATLNQNIVVRQERTQPCSSSHERPGKNAGHIDLTLNDDDGYLSSDTERGSVVDVTEPRQFHEDDYLDDDQLESLLQSWNEDTGKKAKPATQHLATIPLQEYNGLVAGMAVELSGGHIMRIKQILRLITGDIYLQGLYFKELTELDRPFPQRPKELCWLIEEEADGNVHLEREVPISDVSGVCKVALTNYTWRTFVPAAHDSYICRLVWQKTSEKGEWIIRYLTYEEADDRTRAYASTIRKEWRGETTPYGAETVSTSNLTAAERKEVRRSLKKQRQYSFGDAFCGAGGVSVGAWKAGLRVKYGIDIDKAACKTWGTNFVHSDCYHADFYSWIALQDDEVRVDISHSSPPCQPFSPAHTRSYNQQRDEENSSLIFSAFNMIQKVKPRIHTIEETFGVPSRYKETFLRMIQDFLELGYSIHSKTIACAKYGVPQLRRRLFIIAAGPGEKLPAFPVPTHGPGLQPYVTIKDAIRNIPRRADQHDPENTVFQDGRTRAPYDENTLAKTITCGGGEGNYHPSGLRPFTIRELACLQTFPVQYRFPTAYAKKQVGNSVPPRLAEVIFRTAIKSLQETDDREYNEAVVVDRLGRPWQI